MAAVPSAPGGRKRKDQFFLSVHYNARERGGVQAQEKIYHFARGSRTSNSDARRAIRRGSRASPLMPRVQRRIFFGAPLPPLDPAFSFRETA
jgi:hypothetical protein